MVYRFLILSDEVANFKREIQINSEATFLDLHHAILDAAQYTRDDICSFFICDDDWSKKVEITLVDMGASADEDIYLMEETALEDLLEDEQQKLLFIFDYMYERAFFMELYEIIPGKNLEKPLCSLSIGQPPAQTLTVEQVEKRTEQYVLGEDFYGDSDYNEDELENFDELDQDSIDTIIDDERF